MELKDFVKATLEQIVEGVADVQKAVSALGAVINPSNQHFKKDGQWNSLGHAMPQDVVFDVALTATERRGSSEGIGVFLGSVNLGKKNDTVGEQVSITKVKFTVPLVLPPDEKLVGKSTSSGTG